MMIGLLLLAGMAQPDPPLDCANVMAQQDMNQCAYRDFQAADTDLNRLWREVLAAARADDRELDRRTDRQPTHEATVRNAQRAWITFRDAHCTWSSFQFRGGSMQPMIFEGCRAGLTRERIAQLRPDPDR